MKKLKLWGIDEAGNSKVLKAVDVKTDDERNVCLGSIRLEGRTLVIETINNKRTRVSFPNY